jgi:hypothetical protein
MDDEQKNYNSAFLDFQRELGPRVTKRKTTELLGAFLNQKEGSETALRDTFNSFPSSVQEKAFKLIDKYRQGFQPQKSPWDVAAEQNIFERPDFSNTKLDSDVDRRLINWLGIDPERNLKVTEDTTVNKEYPSSRTPDYRTGGNLVDVLENEAIDRPGFFYKELDRIGATKAEKQYLQNYIYNEDIRGKTGKVKPSVKKAIDSLAEKASSNESWVSFPEKEYTLFRGENLPADRSIPEVGEIYSKDRPVSFATALNVTDQFMGGLTSPNKNEENRKVLYTVTEYADEAKPKLLIPGNESEVITPSTSRFEVTGRAKLQANPGYFDPASDVELVRLRQLYGVDPLSASFVGGKDLVSKNRTGAVFGAALSALNPDVAGAIENNQYKKAARTVAKDVALGALTEGAMKAAAPVVQQVAPRAATALTPALRLAGPVGTGVALFSQGRPGSLTDVLTRKATQYPIPFTPRVQADPATDVGARASRWLSNEGNYILNQLRKKRLPYFGN